MSRTNRALERGLGRWSALGLLGATLLGAAPQAFAQGCSMCRLTAGESGNPQALNLAILVLLIPTLSIFVGILTWAFRHRNPPEERHPFDA